MKSKNFKGKRGTSSRLLNEYVSKTIKREKKKEKNIDKKGKSNGNKSGHFQEEKSLLKRPKGIGRLVSPDIRDISVGVHAIRNLIENSLQVFSSKTLQGENKNINKLKEGIVLYTDTINLFLNRSDRFMQEQSNLKEYVEELRNTYRAAQAARDGVLIKQESRTEIDENGEEKQIKYDVSMTEREVLYILDNYRNIFEMYRYNQLSNYINIGINIVGVLGMIQDSLKNKDAEDKESVSLVSVGILAASFLKLFSRQVAEPMWKKSREVEQVKRRKTDDFLNKEQISYLAEQDTIEEIKKYAEEEHRLQDEGNNRQFLLESSITVITALVTGMYVTNQVRANGKKTLDSKTFSDTLISLGTTKGYVGSILQTIIRMKHDLEAADELKLLTIQVEEIEKQMKEKIYPLIGAAESFDSFSVENLDGKFYPTTNYETGEISYGINIKVPEFSVKRGQTVLLTGDSGAGKSTFLRLLKRGDIDNRGCIKLDNGKVVDNLGKEFISFKPSTELGNEGTVLSQITGKESISELDQSQRKKLIQILGELNLYDDRIFDDMASKRFSQFSTGQQRRLALSKMLYRIKDGTSVVIVDEPVGNVQDSLIKEQLEIIKKYAMDNNMMLILVTHRIDLAEKIVDKRYHISKDGVMQEVEVKEQEDPREFT